MSNTEMPTEIQDFGAPEQEHEEHSLVDSSADPTEAQLISLETEQKQAPRPV